MHDHLSSQASPHLVEVQFGVGTGRLGRGAWLVALQGGLKGAFLLLPIQILLLSPVLFLPPRRKHPLLSLLEIHGHPPLPALPLSPLRLLALNLLGLQQMGEGLLVESFGKLAARLLEWSGRRELPMRVASACEGIVSGRGGSGMLSLLCFRSGLRKVRSGLFLLRVLFLEIGDEADFGLDPFVPALGLEEFLKDLLVSSGALGFLPLADCLLLPLLQCLLEDFPELVALPQLLLQLLGLEGCL